MTVDAAAVEPDAEAEYVDVEPVRLSKIRLKAYTIRVERTGSALHSVTGPVMPYPDQPQHSCRQCEPIPRAKAPDAGIRPIEVLTAAAFKQLYTRRVVEMEQDENESKPVPVQNLRAELAGREAMTVTSQGVHKDDKLQDDGWIKLVTKVVINGNDVVIHFAPNPYGPTVTYQYGHPALVYRMVPHAGR